ncbi:MAG: metallophosphoesterase family protein, partial [bacterium]|nr:metallophosphoesterase family protein [bacterium]
RHRTTTFKVGARPYVDEAQIKVEACPKELEGATLVRAIQERAWETQLVGVFRTTPYPSSDRPDQVVLTWSGDPKTTQTIQWRTNMKVKDGSVRFKKKAGQGDPVQVSAQSAILTDRYLANDAVVHRHTARLEDLEPATAYAYQVGSATADSWSEWSEFTTAPDEVVPFSFVYMGDAQNGLDTWGKLVHEAFAARPDAAFYVMAGDLVNRGIERNDWDVLFQNASDIYDRRQLVPCIGNHECQGDDGPWMYLDLFALPTNGPDTIKPEKAYTIEYSNALFVILDTNEPVSDQTAWLDEQLSGSDATWKFLVYHHPAYSSASNRDNAGVRTQWGALCDKYHVDMALQGHDHAYLRTYPMKGGERVASPKEGTVYIVSTSGTKYYDQGQHDYTEFGMTNVSTYQVLDIKIDGDTLTYRAYDMEGELRDELVIEK